MLKIILLILIPVLITPLLFLPIIFSYMIFSAVIGPIISIIFLILIIWKFRKIIDLKITLFSITIGFVYIILTFLFIKSVFALSFGMIPILHPLDYEISSVDMRDSMITYSLRYSMIVASSYLAFIVGIFISQMVKNKIFKIIIFLLVGFGMTLIVFNPIIEVLFFL